MEGSEELIAQVIGGGTGLGATRREDAARESQKNSSGDRSNTAGKTRSGRRRNFRTRSARINKEKKKIAKNEKKGGDSHSEEPDTAWRRRARRKSKQAGEKKRTASEERVRINKFARRRIDEEGGKQGGEKTYAKKGLQILNGVKASEGDACCCLL